METRDILFVEQILAYIIAIELLILGLMYGLSEIQTMTGVRGFIFLILWGMALSIFNNAGDITRTRREES